MDNAAGRAAAWCLYGFLQGLVCTGLWILAHECGHGAFSSYRRVNDCIGWAAHSFLLVPYFSWKFSHARHHRFTGHMELDTAFVPRTRIEYFTRRMLGLIPAHLFDDVPVVTLVRLVAHQLLGWPSYLLFNVSAGAHSRQQQSSDWWRRSHFESTSAVFRPSERIYILLSDVGLLATCSLLYWGASHIGSVNMFLLYGVPYLWVHHWLGVSTPPSTAGRGPRAPSDVKRQY